MANIDSSQPIGIFDSGLGGLTVVKEILKILPNEDIIYFGDTGRTPYGPRSKDIIIEFSRQDTNFLLEQNVKIIVVACNTASAQALDEIRKDYDIEMIGVIEPGAISAVRATKNGKVGIIGTAGTISSDSYARTINRLDSSIKVFSMACPLFVPLVEEGYLDKEATRLIAEDYLSIFTSNGIDTLVLGCTHYPLLKGIIHEILGRDIVLIDSAEETAQIVYKKLIEMNLLREKTASVLHKFYVSDFPERFHQVARHFMGDRIQNVIRIDINKY
ncbi:MAG TPA: glutamate racemase [candidate division Zixibacteria bacterium]|nr:glutamate racemase [candidate division Zixibacteria bacterium]HEQ98448.1 glutamate racemase [candidate division Zixibacteria bacterium]